MLFGNLRSSHSIKFIVLYISALFRIEVFVLTKYRYCLISSMAAHRFILAKWHCSHQNHLRPMSVPWPPYLLAAVFTNAVFLSHPYHRCEDLTKLLGSIYMSLYLIYVQCRMQFGALLNFTDDSSDAFSSSVINTGSDFNCTPHSSCKHHLTTATAVNVTALLTMIHWSSIIRMMWGSLPLWHTLATLSVHLLLSPITIS